MTLVAGAATAALVLAVALAAWTLYRSPGRVRSSLQVALGLALAVLITSGALALVGWPARKYLDDDTQRAWNRNLGVVADFCRLDRSWTSEQEARFRRAVDELVDIVDDHGDEWSSSGVAESLDEQTEELLDSWTATYRAGRCDGPPGAGRYLVRR